MVNLFVHLRRRSRTRQVRQKSFDIIAPVGWEMKSQL